jgi:hypothetical protein
MTAYPIKSKVKIQDTTGAEINPASNEVVGLLRKLFILLKPLQQITGGQSSRLSVDVNTAGTLSTVTTVTTVTTCASVTNIANVGGVGAFSLMRAQNNVAFSQLRSKISQ